MALTEEEKRERARWSQKKYYEKVKGSDAFKKKAAEHQRKWRLKNKAKTKMYNQIYEKNNREKINAKQRGFNRRHRVKLNLCQQEKSRSQRARLDDVYVKNVICTNSSNLKCEHIPQSLIEAKRLELQMKRFIKEQENE